MPRLKDKNGKVYGWSDEAINLYYQTIRIYGNISVLLNEDSKPYKRFSDLNLKLEDERVLFLINDQDYLRKDPGHYPEYVTENFNDTDTELGHIYLGNMKSSDKVPGFLTKDGVKQAKNLLESISRHWKKEENNVPKESTFDPIREYYSNMAYVADHKNGNYMEAMSKKPHLIKLNAQTTGIPNFSDSNFAH